MTYYGIISECDEKIVFDMVYKILYCTIDFERSEIMWMKIT